MRTALRTLLPVALALLQLACERVTHENVDRWRQTEKGPDKLEAALASDEHPADLRAHAAQNLVQIERFDAVEESLEAMPEDQRAAVLAELAPRLWEDARVDGDMTVPSTRQTNAKDALYFTRRFADDVTRAKIDSYLIDWFAGGYYEGRATAGRVTGNMAMRAVGPAAGPRLLEGARSILAKPPDEKGMRPQLGDRLLEALAFSGHPEALALLFDVMENPRGDVSLPERAMGALHRAYVEPVGTEPANGKALVPVLPEILAVVRDEDASGTMVNDAVDLVAAVGMPECLPPFVDMVSYPHTAEAFRWMGVQRGIRCGQAGGIVPVVEALPATTSYQRGLLDKYLWDEVLKIPARDRVAEAARTLLQSDSWVARVSGVELLGALARPATAAEDAERIRELAGDGRVLRGWWGEQKGVPPGERRQDPTLGQVAREVAQRLEDVANEGGAK